MQLRSETLLAVGGVASIGMAIVALVNPTYLQYVAYGLGVLGLGMIAFLFGRRHRR